MKYKGCIGGMDGLKMFVYDIRSYNEFKYSTVFIPAQHFCCAVGGWGVVNGVF